MSTYSTNLGIELIGTGEQSGTWGTTTNTNLGTLIEQAISGYTTQAVATGTDTTITIPDGTTGVARNMYIELTGTGGASTNLIVPTKRKLYFIYNNTSSGQVTVKVSAGTGVSVANGAKVVLVYNGTDIVNATSYPTASGTTNYVAKFTGTNSVGNSIVYDDGTNVGIGTSTPATKLEVYGGASGTVTNLTVGNAATAAVFGIDSSNNVQIRTAQSVPMLFYTAGTERARIPSAGGLLVGKTASSASTVGFEVDTGGTVYSTKTSNSSGDASYYLYSTGAGQYQFYVSTNGTVNAVNTTIAGISDQRLKENVRDLDVGLDAVMALQPRKFDWKDGKGKGTKDDRGFIAQEFEQVFPDLVGEWKTPAPEGEAPYKTIRQDLIPVLVKAMQEQQVMIDDLRARIAQLESK